MQYILFIICIFWAWSIFKFRLQYSRNLRLCDWVQLKYEENPSQQNEVEYASALMLCQNYQLALKLFKDFKRERCDASFPFLDMDIPLCNMPLLWIPQSKNMNGSWWHSFLFVRMGVRRCLAIRDHTLREVNAVIREIQSQRSL